MIERLLTLPERRAGVLIAAIALLFAAAYGSSLVLLPKPDGRVLIGDALHHYVQLRSAVFDGDLHFRNEYIRMYRLQGGEPDTEWVYEDTSTGHVRNLMPVGPALLWAPLFLVVTGCAALANAIGWGYPLDGYGRLFQATAGLSGIAAAAIGIWLSWLASRRVFSARAAIWACIALWLASSALYYSVISPTYSHAASLLVNGAFWYAWLRLRDASHVRRYLVLGVLTGLAALMRWQDVILIIPVALELTAAAVSRRIGLGRAAGLLLLAACGAAIAFLPQMVVWGVLYGRPLAIPQGPAFMRWTEPALLSVLFSDWHGLFTWTPLVAVAVAGMVPLARRDPALAVAGGVVLGLSWYVNAAVADWWAGEAFGARRFISCVPVLALALAALIDRWAPSPRQIAAATAVVVAHTFLLLVQYQAFMHGLREIVPYPRGAYNLWIARFVVPVDLAREWLTR